MMRVLQGRPHGVGVPHDASHAAPAQQPPPKAAAKPGRKPKAMPAAGALATAEHCTQQMSLSMTVCDLFSRVSHASWMMCTADGGGSVPNGRHYPAAHVPPHGRMQTPNGLAHGDDPSYGTADAYRHVPELRCCTDVHLIKNASAPACQCVNIATAAAKVHVLYV